MTAWSDHIRLALNIANQSASNAWQFAQNNPGTAVAAVASTAGLTVLAAPAVVVAPAIGILNTVGFGSGGIVASKAAQELAAGRS